MRKQTKLVAVLSAAALLAIGASMTSFAAAGWVQEGEDWVYLNKDGDRDANVWRRSGDNYYWLDENGVMARNALIKDDTVDAIYCVDENGVKVTNAWREVPNDEGAQVGSVNTDDTPTVLYYYFGSSGKAYVGGDKKVREIDGKYYMFNEEGQMLYGWQTGAKETDLYYFGTEREGFAYIDWQQLEPRDYLNGEDYNDLEWFYFGTNGKASINKSQYIDSRYYHFDVNGVLDDDWYTNTATLPAAASGAQAFANVNGSKTGWVYTGDADLPEDQRYDNDSMYWYYLVNVSGQGKVARSIPYNYQTNLKGEVLNAVGDTPTGFARAMVIKNKTYIFNSDGKMLKGFVVLDWCGNDGAGTVIGDETQKVYYRAYRNGTVKCEKDDAGVIKTTPVAYNGVAATGQTPDHQLIKKFAGADEPFASVAAGRTLVNGLYYFSEAGGSLTGQMQTGRTAVTKEGETFYYYFSKDNLFPGYAYTNAVQDGYLYGEMGRCITADAGNSYAVHELQADVRIMNKKDTNGELVKIKKGERVIVSRTGKVKMSGSVTIDGIKYTVSSVNYAITDAKYVD